MPRPIPDVEPVTMAVLPLSCMGASIPEVVPLTAPPPDAGQYPSALGSGSHSNGDLRTAAQDLRARLLNAYEALEPVERDFPFRPCASRHLALNNRLDDSKSAAHPLCAATKADQQHRFG